MKNIPVHIRPYIKGNNPPNMEKYATGACFCGDYTDWILLAGGIPGLKRIFLKETCDDHLVSELRALHNQMEALWNPSDVTRELRLSEAETMTVEKLYDKLFNLVTQGKGHYAVCAYEGNGDVSEVQELLVDVESEEVTLVGEG